MHRGPRPAIPDQASGIQKVNIRRGWIRAYEAPPPDPAASWDTRERQWAMNYWEQVALHRDLTLADSHLPPELVEPTALIVVDAVHGAALSGLPTGTSASRSRELAQLRATFAIGLDTIVAGIAARAEAERS